MWKTPITQLRIYSQPHSFRIKALLLISMYVIEPYAIVVTGFLQVTPLIKRVLNKIMIFGWPIKTFVLCVCVAML